MQTDLLCLEDTKQRGDLLRVLSFLHEFLMPDKTFAPLDADSTISIKTLLLNYIWNLQIPRILMTHRGIAMQNTGDVACSITRGSIGWQGLSCNLQDSYAIQEGIRKL